MSPYPNTETNIIKLVNLKLIAERWFGDNNGLKYWQSDNWVDCCTSCKYAGTPSLASDAQRLYEHIVANLKRITPGSPLMRLT
jgi:hypothetical protein